MSGRDEGHAAPPDLRHAPWDVVDERGFAAVHVGWEAEREALLARFRELEVDEGHAYFATSVHSPNATARSIDLLVKDLLGDHLRAACPGLEPVLGAFISKGARFGGAVDLHQDWTYTDEAVHRCRVLWVPLVDVDHANGAMAFVPGSHRWTDHVRSDDPTSPTAGLQDALLARAELVPLQAGEAVLYDPAAIHGSSANVSDGDRPAVGILMAPVDAQLLLYHQPAEGPLECFEVDAELYASQTFRARPTGYPLRSDHGAQPVTPADLAAWLDGPPPPLQPQLPVQLSTPGRSAPTVAADLRDRMARDGFATLRLLDADLAATLRSAFLHAFGAHGTGVHLDLDLDLEGADADARPYRRHVHRLLVDVLAEPIASALPDGRLVDVAYQCQWPGGEHAVGLRRSPVAGADHLVWIALQDTLGHEGQLRVVRGSHQVGTPGAAPPPAWLRHDALLREHLVDLPLRAGEAAVLHRDLVHATHGANTPEANVVVLAGIDLGGGPQPADASADLGEAELRRALAGNRPRRGLGRLRR